MLRQHAVAGWQTTLYEVAAAATFLVLAVHAVFRETERWKLVLLATVPGLLLPYVSADYTLIQLYFPLVFFLNARRVSRWDVVYIALFGILLVPVDYYYILGDISISVIIYPASLVALVLLAIFDVQRASVPGFVGVDSAPHASPRRPRLAPLFSERSPLTCRAGARRKDGGAPSPSRSLRVSARCGRSLRPADAMAIGGR
jgi:hypothetical protein